MPGPEPWLGRVSDTSHLEPMRILRQNSEVREVSSFVSRFPGITQMVKNRKQNTQRRSSSLRFLFDQYTVFGMDATGKGRVPVGEGADEEESEEERTHGC